MNDPNGLVFYEGEYHLFYQFNPFGDKWGHMSWGHAVSPDLVHWRHLPVALPEEDGIMIFSGSAVVDWKNTTGFGKNGRPPLIAIYTGRRNVDDHQFQCIAYSNDKGRTWTKYAGNPVIDIGSKNFRDPKVFWHAPSRRWVMVVSLAADRKVRFYGSPNLKEWTQLSDFGPAGAVKGVWECPDLFPLKLDGAPARTNWVLIVNVGSGSVAGGSGGQYFVGNFDGTHFTPDRPAASDSNEALWVDYGRDYYAAVSWSDVPKGRRLWIGWMSNWEYAQDVPTSPWRSAMSLPRELHLKKFDDGVRLVQMPVKEVQSLRERHYHIQKQSFAAANASLHQRGISGEVFELDAELEPASASECGVKLRKGAHEETVISYDTLQHRLFVDRTHSGRVNFNKAFPGVHSAPVPLENGRIKLNIFVDRSSIEVFANDGRVTVTELVFPDSESIGVELYANDPEKAQVRTLDFWRLRSVWR